MTVCRFLAFAATLLLLQAGVGCRDRGNEPIPAETDDPFFVQGKQLQRLGRNPEALTAFLKVIEKRGERGAAESHLEAGQIYLNHTKDPVEAYHHFRKYLELQPNSRQAELVRGMVKAALREFARTIPARPSDDQTLRPQVDDETARLRREVDELRAELAVLRGGGGVPVSRSTHAIRLPVESRATLPIPTSPVVDAPISRAPPRTALPPVNESAANSNPIMPANPPRNVLAPTTRPNAAPSRTTAAPINRAVTSSGYTHTVVAKDTLFNISKKYGVRMEDLAAVNGLPSVGSSLRLGTVLKIPAPNTAR